MHSLNKFKILLFFIFISIFSSAEELSAPKEILKNKIIESYFLKVKESYSQLGNKVIECNNKEENNTIINFNYAEKSLRNIDIFKFVYYTYLKNANLCSQQALNQVSYDILVFQSILDEYKIDGKNFIHNLFFSIGGPIDIKKEFEIKKSYDTLNKEAKLYLESMLGNTPFNIKPFINSKGSNSTKR